jgi:hypothetical protein
LLTDRARDVRRQEGMIGLFRVGLRFLLSPVYRNESFYLTVIRVSADYKSEESRPRIDESQLNFRVVTSNDEAARLEDEGFRFRTSPTYFNYNLKVYAHWLDSGAIAFCTFVGKEFAAINWGILSQHAQDALKEIPLRVDYANHEMFPRSSWVNPAFRNMQLFYYTTRKRNRYLLDRGICLMRTVIDCTNKPGIGITRAQGYRVYGRGQLTRILWRRRWKEVHYTELTDLPGGTAPRNAIGA